MTFSREVIRKLMRISNPLIPELKGAYEMLPPTRCRRRTRCCSLLPEMTLAEALAGIRRVSDMTPARRRHLTQNITRYFFLNPVEIVSCPFLDRTDCLIYDDRFLGCRTYGLWSQPYYATLGQQSRQSKKQLQKQWNKLGVSLPQTIIDFEAPYCADVEIVGPTSIDDDALLQVADAVTVISARFSPWHQLFGQGYFSDLSFLLTSLVIGFREAIQMKFSIVSEILNTGNRTKLDNLVRELPDLFTDLI